jgi:trehalose 6-phosphate synthase/phosphatase
VSIKEDHLQVTSSVGELATVLKSVHKESNGTCIGWSGLTQEELTPKLEDKVEKAVHKEQCVTVNLIQDDLDLYYYGFSNRTLWPLFRYFIEYTEYDPASWNAYQRVNENLQKWF